MDIASSSLEGFDRRATGHSPSSSARSISTTPIIPGRDALPDVDHEPDVTLTTSTGPGVNIDVVAASATDPSSWTGRLTLTIRPQLGELEIVAPLARGEELLDAMDAPTTHATRFDTSPTSAPVNGPTPRRAAYPSTS